MIFLCRLRQKYLQFQFKFKNYTYTHIHKMLIYFFISVMNFSEKNYTSNANLSSKMNILFHEVYKFKSRSFVFTNYIFNA